ncbi:hypothetical protein JCM16814_34200 [Desulfobaculum senezii]
MVSGWKKTLLGDVLTLQRGFDLPTKDRIAGDYCVVSSSGISGSHNQFKVPPPVVVTGRYGTIGKVFFIRSACWPLNTTLWVKDFKGNDPQFIYYLLQTINYFDYSDKAAVPGVNRNHVHTAEVKIPLSLSEQQAIASVLGALDDKIDCNSRMNETLEAMARAMFKDWFVDFGPTKAKMEGRAPYLAPEIWDLFPDRLDDEGNPKGWEYSEIGRETKVLGGATPSTKEPTYWEGGTHHWATPKDLSGLASPVLLDTARKITDQGVAKISSGSLPIGTVLLSSRAPVGYLAIAEVETAINQGFIAMICKKRLSNLFVLLWCAENMEYIKSISGGSTFAEISKKAFRPIPVTIPGNAILHRFEELATPLYHRIVANSKEQHALAQTRDLLLPKLMSGEIRIKDAERAVEDVL